MFLSPNLGFECFIARPEVLVFGLSLAAADVERRGRRRGSVPAVVHVPEHGKFLVQLRVFRAQRVVFLFEAGNVGRLARPVVALLCEGLCEREREVGRTSSGHGG